MGLLVTRRELGGEGRSVQGQCGFGFKHHRAYVERITTVMNIAVECLKMPSIDEHGLRLNFA